MTEGQKRAIRRFTENGRGQAIEEKAFCAKSMNTYRTLYPDLIVQEQIQERANRWTQARDELLTMEIQKMDEHDDLDRAELCWNVTYMHQMFRFMDREIIHERALEIRML
jgi:uncharacterized protein (DUF952 family)